jgi:hypothetical protein
MEAIIIGAMVAVFSWAATKEEVFSDLRKNYFQPWCKDHTLPYLVRKVCYIPTCEYCFSFWFTLLMMLVFRHQVWYDDWRGYVLAHGVTWASAVLYMSIYQRIRVDIRYEQVKANNEEKK